MSDLNVKLKDGTNNLYPVTKIANISNDSTTLQAILDSLQSQITNLKTSYDTYTATFGKIYTFTKTLTLTADWQPTGIDFASMPGGTYVVQVTNIYNGANTWQKTNVYTGIFYLFSGNTNASERYEISLHSGGHAHNDYVIKLSTYCHTGNTTNTTIEIAGDRTYSNSCDISFKFVRIL